MRYATDDLRVDGLRPLLPPAILMEEIPLTDTASTTVALGRKAVSDVLGGRDDRLIVVLGPCSIHDVAAGIAANTNEDENDAAFEAIAVGIIVGGDERNDSDYNDEKIGRASWRQCTTCTQPSAATTI